MQSRILAFAFCTLGLLALSGSALAQQEKGDKQMSFSLSFSSMSSEGTSSNSMNFQYTASRFFTKHLEMGFGWVGVFSTGTSTNAISPFFNYNVLSANGKFVFYFGAQYLLSVTSTEAGGSKTTIMSGGVGGKIGIRSYLSDNVFIFVGPNYSAFANNMHQIDLTAGVGVLFKKTRKTQ